MERVGADAYVYARASGMLARSFTGKRARKLFAARRLQDLWSTVFGDEAPLVPEGMLALRLERRAEQLMVDDVRDLLSNYDSPDPVLSLMLSSFDVGNLKAAASALAMARKDAPFFVDTGNHSLVDTSCWPDIAKMTRAGPFSWYNQVPAVTDLPKNEIRLDNQYYRQVWDAVSRLRGADRASVEPLVRMNITFQNIVWAMRLKVYYRKGRDEIATTLACSDADEETKKLLCQPAIEALGIPVDSWAAWSRWKYRWMLNPHEEGTPWSFDPRWAQLACDTRMYRAALSAFHRSAFTPGMLVSYFMARQLELQMIRVAAEGIRLGADGNEIATYTGGIAGA